MSGLGRIERRRTDKRRTGAIHPLLAAVLLFGGCAHAKPLPPGKALTAQERREAIRRAGVWSPSDVRSVDFKVGPEPQPGLAPNEWVACEYKSVGAIGGHSPKFTCETSPGHELRVKYGQGNAEVYGEVLSTRLFWGLGFAADRMYPVRVRCHGCSPDPKRDPAATNDVVEFDPAAIERKFPGRAMESKPDSGWKWAELDDIGPEAGENAKAQRDALKLLAAFVQHTDSKAGNQRLVCPKGQEVGESGCRKPLLMVHDLGLTFGKGGIMSKNKNSMRLDNWKEVPVWKDPALCVAQAKSALNGSLHNPTISEEGRAFLAGLLVQLTDAQLHDLFETARVTLRRDDDGTTAPAGIDDWVATFKSKRAEIVDQRCPR